MSSPFNILDNMFKNAMSLNDNREIFVFIFAMALESPPNSRGQPLGWTPCSSGACSPSGGARICPRTGHFLVFNKEDLSFYYEIWEPFGPTVIFSPLTIITCSISTLKWKTGLFSTLERKTDHMTCFPIVKCCEKRKWTIHKTVTAV